MDKQLCFQSHRSHQDSAGTQSYAALSQHSDREGVHEETVTGLNPALLHIMPAASKEAPVVIMFSRTIRCLLTRETPLNCRVDLQDMLVVVIP